MDITLYNHIYALIGSLAAIITLMAQHKNKIDRGEVKGRLRDYFNKQWDDFLYLIFIAQVLVLVQEYLVNAYIQWQDIEGGWDIYFNNEELISFAVGLFGNVLFIKFFKMGKSKINEQ